VQIYKMLEIYNLHLAILIFERLKVAEILVNWWKKCISGFGHIVVNQEVRCHAEVRHWPLLCGC
jgi:hypothetical protein